MPHDSPVPLAALAMKARSPARPAASCAACAKPMPCWPLARDLDKAVGLRPGPGGEQTRTAVVERTVAQAFAVKELDHLPEAPGRIAQYTITATGKSALRRLLDEDFASAGRPPSALPRANSSFQAQHAQWGTAEVTEAGGKTRTPARQFLPSRRWRWPGAAQRGATARVFPHPRSGAGGRGGGWREDFEGGPAGGEWAARRPELGQVFLTAATAAGSWATLAWARGQVAARRRVSDALDDLGPGLARCGPARVLLSRRARIRRTGGWAGRHVRARSC